MGSAVTVSGYWSAQNVIETVTKDCRRWSVVPPALRIEQPWSDPSPVPCDSVRGEVDIVRNEREAQRSEIAVEGEDVFHRKFARERAGRVVHE